MKKNFLLTPTLACAVLLTGCSTTDRIGLNHVEFGNAVKQNIAAQSVNPNAPIDDSAIEANGERAALAQTRYVTDQVEEPEDISSRAAAGTGAAGGGTNAGATP